MVFNYTIAPRVEWRWKCSFSNIVTLVRSIKITIEYTRSNLKILYLAMDRQGPQQLVYEK